MENPQQTVDEWNQKHPAYNVIVDVKDDFGIITRRRTQSVAWVLCGEPVVQVSGISGGYLLERCKVVH